MSLIDERQDFSDVADVFLLHGSMQSPAFLDGRLCALLALRDVSAEGWLEEVCLGLGVEQPRAYGVHSDAVGTVRFGQDF